MTATVTEIETTTIEALAFDIPCEYRGHERFGQGPARWIALLTTPLPCGCPSPGSIYLCDGCCHRRIVAPMVTCVQCGKQFRWADCIIRIEPINIKPHRPSDG